MFGNERRDWWWFVVGGATLAGLGLAIWKRQELAFVVTDMADRGTKLTNTSLDDDGTIPDDPAELAAQASAVMGREVSLDVYALARMIRSEGALEGLPRAHVAINDALNLGGWSLARLITYSTVSARDGLFGKQKSRRYSSAHDPYVGDVLTAEQAIAEAAAGVDPTGGADHFVDKGGFLHPGQYDDVVTRWGAQGLEPYTVDGYPSSFVVFRKG